jgi:hypothetical protein
MSKSPNQKMKLLYLMRIFLEQTDEEHSLTLREIEEELAKYGVSAERKALYNDFRVCGPSGSTFKPAACGPTAITPPDVSSDRPNSSCWRTPSRHRASSLRTWATSSSPRLKAWAAGTRPGGCGAA